MSVFDVAKLCEQLGSFLLNKLSSKFNKNNIGYKRNVTMDVMIFKKLTVTKQII